MTPTEETQLAAAIQSMEAALCLLKKLQRKYENKASERKAMARAAVVADMKRQAIKRFGKK